MKDNDLDAKPQCSTNLKHDGAHVVVFLPRCQKCSDTLRPQQHFEISNVQEQYDENCSNIILDDWMATLGCHVPAA